MKVTLDLDALLQDKAISQEEYDRLSRLAARDTGSLAVNILVGGGVTAVAAGALGLLPSVGTAIVIGLALMGLGVVARGPRWVALATVAVLIGALLFGGAILMGAEATPRSFLLVSAVLAVVAILADSALLIALAVLSLAGAIGGMTGYAHATYEIVITEPTLTIVIFSALAFGLMRMWPMLPAPKKRLASAAAGTSLFLINFGFWVGSLWGDPLGWMRSGPTASSVRVATIPDWVFAILWALGLLGVALWAVRHNRRWVVTLAAVFGAIHFYTQWFERLGATPFSVLAGGVGLLLFAWAFVRWTQAKAGSP